ncbi:MAG: hypothetical protein FWB90_00600 [Fibromonadales bacterium]|nr:hypothetical protein [Fibromonadales bacterium]
MTPNAIKKAKLKHGDTVGNKIAQVSYLDNRRRVKLVTHDEFMRTGKRNKD